MTGPRAATSRTGAFASAVQTWEAPDKAVIVQLQMHVVNRLAEDAFEAFKSVPKRGAEIGGILLGRFEPGEKLTVVVEDYEPVRCEHRTGPSYSLSDADLPSLGEAVQRWRRHADARTYVVGFYRSHTRPGMQLDDSDAAVADSYFHEPNQLVLLVKPSSSGSSTGAFFLRDDDGRLERESMHSEFSMTPRLPVLDDFDGARSFSVARPGRLTTFQESALTRQDPHPGPGYDDQPEYLGLGRELPPPARRRHYWAWAAVVLVALGGLGTVAYLKSPWSLKQPSARSGAAAPAAEISPLGLKVGRETPYLRLTWNQASEPVLNALQGRLSVADGSVRRELDLDIAQLRGGSIAYAPTSDDVSFRLELFLTAGKTISESVRIIGGTPVAVQPSPLRNAAAATRPRVAEFSRPAQPAPPVRESRLDAVPRRTTDPEPAQPAPPEAAKPNVAAAAADQTPAGTRSESGTAPGALPKSFAISSGAQEPPAAAKPGGAGQAATQQAAAAGNQAPAQQQAAAPPKPAAVASSQVPAPPKPVPTAQQGGPGAGGRESAAGSQPASSTNLPPAVTGTYVPPKPIRTVRPTMPNNIRRLVADEVTVEITVQIDATGKVVGSRTGAAYKGIPGYLAGLAENAARMWRFSPAVRNGKPVPSEYTLQFNFRTGSY